jgi:hypothetical protein
MRKTMRRTLALTVLCAAAAFGAVFADQPLKFTIQAEGVNLPEGSVCQADLRVEYRIVEPRTSAKDGGRYVGVTDGMATFTAPAPERHNWRHVAPKKSSATVSDPTTSNGRRSFEFTIPAAMPRAHAGSRAAFYVPVSYTIAVPGFPEVRQQQTFVVRLDDAGAGRPVSRCLRFELINGTQLRSGLLRTCNDSFEQLGAQPLATSE